MRLNVQIVMLSRIWITKDRYIEMRQYFIEVKKIE